MRRSDHRSISERFARSVPLPGSDRLRASADRPLGRSRDDETRPTPELAGRSPDELRRSLERAIEALTGLAMTEPIRDRLLTWTSAMVPRERVMQAVRGGRSLREPPVRSPLSRRGPTDPERPATVEPRRNEAADRLDRVRRFGSERQVDDPQRGGESGSAAITWFAGCTRASHRAQALTYVPHVLLPALRRLFPEQRSLRVEARFDADPPNEAPVFAAVRAALGDAGVRAASGHHPDRRSITRTGPSS
mgnify:CR=1 FL=1